MHYLSSPFACGFPYHADLQRCIRLVSGVRRHTHILTSQVPHQTSGILLADANTHVSKGPLSVQPRLFNGPQNCRQRQLHRDLQIDLFVSQGQCPVPNRVMGSGAG